MSTFRAFQTGLQAGQQQAKMRREDDARAKAAEAFGMGNFEGAVTPLMSAGLMQDAEAYERAGARRKEADATKAYAEAFRTGMGTGPQPDRRGAYQAVATAAGQQGDFGMMADMDQVLSQMDESQASQFASGMEFLGNTALGLKGVPPEQRGAAAVEILKNSPYGNPQIMAQIEQAAADGLITDQELDNFAMQTMSVADRIKAQRPELHNTGQAITATSFGSDGSPSTKVLYQDPQQSGSQSRFRPATREEAGRYGAEAGQIDDSTGRFYPSGGQNAGEFSATERKGFRDKAAAINSLKYLVDEYRKVVNLYGPQLVDSEWDGGLGMRKTKRAQELLAAHNNLMMFLKGPELFNLGVLTGPDVERLQRTLPEPVGAGTIGANKETLAVGLDGLESLINQRLGLIPEQFRTMDAGQTAAPSLTPDEEAELEALRAELGMQ